MIEDLLDDINEMFRLDGTIEDLSIIHEEIYWDGDFLVLNVEYEYDIHKDQISSEK